MGSKKLKETVVNYLKFKYTKIYSNVITPNIDSQNFPYQNAVVIKECLLDFPC